MSRSAMASLAGGPTPTEAPVLSAVSRESTRPIRLVAPASSGLRLPFPGSPGTFLTCVWDQPWTQEGAVDRWTAVLPAV